jgi:hypothetical protein
MCEVVKCEASAQNVLRFVYYLSHVIYPALEILILVLFSITLLYYRGWSLSYGLV